MQAEDVEQQCKTVSDGRLLAPSPSLGAVTNADTSSGDGPTPCSISLGSSTQSFSLTDAAVSLHSNGDGTKVTSMEAVITLAVNCLGASMTVFPSLASDVGWVAAPCLCCLCGWACYASGCITFAACEMAEQITGMPCRSYEGLAEVAGGKVWLRILAVTKNTGMLGYIVVYLRCVYESLESCVGQPGCLSTQMQLTLVYLVVLPLFGTLAMMKDLKTLARLAAIGVISVGTEVACLLIGGVGLLLRIPACDSSSSAEFGVMGSSCRWYSAIPVAKEGVDKGDLLPVASVLGGVGVAMSVFLYSYIIIDTVPNFRASLAEPKRMPSILASAFSICTFVNVLVCCVCYAGFGQNVPNNTLTALKDEFPVVSGVAAVAVVVNLMISTPIYSYCVISFIESTGDDAARTVHSVPNIICRFSIIAFLTFLSHVVPYFKQVIGLVTSVFAVASNIFFPSFFFYMLRSKSLGPEAKSTSTHISSWIFTAVLLTGAIVFIFGIKGSLSELIQKLGSPDDSIHCSNQLSQWTSNAVTI